MASWLRVILLLSLLALVVLQLSCGGSHRRLGTLGQLPLQITQQQPRPHTLGEALALLDDMQAPQGVKLEVFAQLKDALKSALACRAATSGPPLSVLQESPDGGAQVPALQRIVSTPPTGAKNAVPDLAFVDNGDGTISLTWSYYNLADYDQDGVVGVGDIIPLAAHFGEAVPPEDVNSLLAVIDGSGNDVIDIADVTPIAVNFGIEVANYDIQASPSQAGPFASAQQVAMGAGLDAVTQRMHFAAAIEPTPQYWYRVAPLDAEGVAGEPSNILHAPIVLPSLAAPTGLATVAVSAHEVALSWQDNSTYESGFRIERKTGVYGAWSVVGTADANSTSFSDIGLSPFLTYYYRVQAFNDLGSSAYSNEAWASTLGVPPDAPSRLVASGDDAVILNWQDNASYESGFFIERKYDASGSWSRIGTASANTLTFTDSGASPTQPYYYRVIAYNDFGESTFSNEACPLIPASPENLTVGAVTVTQVWLMWNRPPYPSTNWNFRVERRDGENADWVLLPDDETSENRGLVILVNSHLLPSSTYSYRVSQYNKYGCSFPSNEVSATTLQNGALWSTHPGTHQDADMQIDYAGDIIQVMSDSSRKSALIKCTTEGVVVWYKYWEYPEVSWFATKIALDADGNTYVTGNYDYFNNKKDIVLLKFASDGSLLWQKKWDGGYTDEARNLAVGPNGNLYLVGSTNSFGAGQTDVLLLKYSPEGDLLLQQTWGGSDVEIPSDICVDNSGNVIVTGHTIEIGNVYASAFVLKYSPDGTLVWQRYWRTSAEAEGRQVFCDETGAIYATGLGISTNKRYPNLLKYSPDGELLWHRAWENMDDLGDAVIVPCVSGGIYIALNASYRELMKFDSDGTLIWEKYFHGVPSWGLNHASILSVISDDEGVLYLNQIAPIWEDWHTTSADLVLFNGSLTGETSLVSGTQTDLFGIVSNYDETYELEADDLFTKVDPSGL